MINIDKLNENQQEAVKHVDGPCMVLAGPGSGKTRVITYRIVNMVMNEGIPPTRILAISFTKASSIEMKNRALSICNDFRMNKVTFGTFHAVFFRILRKFDGVNLNSILDEKTKRIALKGILKSLNVENAEDDELIGVKVTDGNKDVLLVTKEGMSIRFDENDIRSMGRSAMGVKGITLSNDDKVVSMSLCEEGTDVLVVSENGFGKRTDINEYRTQIRAGKGIKTYNIAEKTGKLVGAEMVNEDDEMMIINSDGVLIRLRVNEISLFGRVTSGVKLMKTDDEVNVVSISKIKMEEE